MTVTFDDILRDTFWHGWDTSEYGPIAFQPPELAGKYKGKGLVICGDAACLWQDLEAFGCRNDNRFGSVQKEGFDFLTVNRACIKFPGKIEHAYSNEPTLLELFVAVRDVQYLPEFGKVEHLHTGNARGSRVARSFNFWPWGGWGTSGLGAGFVGVGLGYNPVVYCGVPLDDGPHLGEPPWRKTAFTREAADTKDGGMNYHWKRASKCKRLFSMSGRTREWLGPPPP